MKERKVDLWQPEGFQEVKQPEDFISDEARVEYVRNHHAALCMNWGDDPDSWPNEVGMAEWESTYLEVKP